MLDGFLQGIYLFMTPSVKKFCPVWELVPCAACIPVNSYKVNEAAKQFVLLSGWPWKHHLLQEDLAAGSTGTVGIYQLSGGHLHKTLTDGLGLHWLIGQSCSIMCKFL